MPTKSVPAKRGRGRPAYQPTAADRRRVSVAAGGGMRHEDIAVGLGISRETLTKYFGAELSQGASQRRMEVLSALHTAAKKGSPSAARAFLAAVPEFMPPPVAPGEQPPAPAVAPVPTPAPLPLAQPLGKKDAANAAAKTAQVGTGWEDILPGAPLQ